MSCYTHSSDLSSSSSGSLCDDCDDSFVEGNEASMSLEDYPSDDVAGTSYYEDFLSRADHNIQTFQAKQAQAIAEIDKHFESLEQRIKKDHSKLVKSVKEYTEARISCIEKCKRLATEQLDRLRGDPASSAAAAADTLTFLKDSAYDISLPAYKVPHIEEKVFKKLAGSMKCDDVGISHLPSPQNIRVVSKSPVSATLEWDKQAYCALFDKLNSANPDISYDNDNIPHHDVKDIRFLISVNDEKSACVDFDKIVTLNLIPGKRYVIKMEAFYHNVRSPVSVIEFVSKEVTPEYYQGCWSTSNPLSTLSTTRKCIKKSNSDVVPVLFVGDTPLNPTINNFWALSFVNDIYPERVLLAGLVPKCDDSGVPDDEGFFSAVQRGWFVSVHTGLLLGSDATPTPNGRTCKVESVKSDWVMSLGFGAKNGSLVFGRSIADVKEAVEDESKMAFRDLPCDVPLYPAVIVASSHVSVEMCYPS